MNKPVAWMELYYGEPNNLSWTDAELRNSGEVYKTIPLYTHPVKELTDEEIDSGISDIVKAIGLNANGLDVEDFARGIEVFKAILRKAQEK